VNQFLEHALYGLAAGCGFWIAQFAVQQTIALIKRMLS
jgi:hypothetical protein